MTQYYLEYVKSTDNYIISDGVRLVEVVYRGELPISDEEFKQKAVNRFDKFISDKKSLRNSELIKTEVA